MKVLEFLRDNYQIIIVLAISLANLFVCIFRKKIQVVDNIYQYIADNLPFYISIAEKEFPASLSGDLKRRFVMECLGNLLAEKFGVNFEPYASYISDSIEKILSTPEKKEVK